MEGNATQDDVFLYDRATGANVLVSRSLTSPVLTANGASRDPSVSADGRWVAFASVALDLVAGRAGGVFLFDRDTATLAWVGPGDQPEVSDDGRWVAFLSSAAGVVPGQVDANGGNDVFLWDRTTGETVLVSRSTASAATAGNGVSSFTPQSESPDVLSADGRWVVFASLATDLVAGASDANASSDVFLFDRVAGTTTLVSHANGFSLVAGDGESGDPGVSADGSHVVFRSQAPSLVPGQFDFIGTSDLFLYRRATGGIELVSRSMVSPARTGNAATSALPRVSADGAYVAFTSRAGDLVVGDFQVDDDAFLFSSPPPGRDYFTVPPCRLFDSREPGSGPALASGVARTLSVHGLCAVPETARAVAVNLTVTQPSGPGHLALHPGDGSLPSTSTINFGAGQTRANHAVLSLALDGTGSLAVTPVVLGNGTVHVIVDVVGYFE
jgi:Tol biopolymer transport system component